MIKNNISNLIKKIFMATLCNVLVCLFSLKESIFWMYEQYEQIFMPRDHEKYFCHLIS